MTDLKPCPFCGGEADISDEGIGTEPYRYWVYCANPSCFVEGTPAFKTESEAIEAWNTRAERTGKLHECEGSFSATNRPVWRCDCGAFMTQYTDATNYHKPRFCPNCGVRLRAV